MSGKRWSPAEKQIVRHYYPRWGTPVTQDRLQEKGFTRTRKAIAKQANLLGVALGIPTGYWTVKEMTWSGNSYRLAKKKAEEAGVLKRYTAASSRAPFVVPEDWAIQYLDELEERRQYTEAWWGVNRVAEELGVNNDYVNNTFRKNNPWSERRKLMKTMERRRGLSRRWMYNPRDVKRVKEELRGA